MGSVHIVAGDWLFADLLVEFEHSVAAAELAFVEFVVVVVEAAAAVVVEVAAAVGC